MQKMRQQFNNVRTIFVQNEASMLQTQELGACLNVLYSDSAEYGNYAGRISHDMQANMKMIEKNRKILANLQAQMSDIDMDYQLFTDMSKKREVDRKKYDHYRTKLAKLREQEAKRQEKNQSISCGAKVFSGTNKQHERLVRNVGKFEQAEHYFQASTKTMDDKMQILIKKLDQLAIFLNIKFFQNITLSYYRTFDEMFRKFENIDNDITDLKFEMDRQA